MSQDCQIFTMEKQGEKKGKDLKLKRFGYFVTKIPYIDTKKSNDFKFLHGKK